MRRPHRWRTRRREPWSLAKCRSRVLAE